MLKLDYDIVNSKIEWKFTGDCEFTKSPVLFNENEVEPFIVYTFKLSPELKQDLRLVGAADEIDEVVAERIKQEFITFVKERK